MRLGNEHLHCLGERIRWSIITLGGRLVDRHGDVLRSICKTIEGGHRVRFDSQITSWCRCAYRGGIRRALHVLVLIEPPSNFGTEAGGSDENRHRECNDDDIAAGLVAPKALEQAFAV